MCGIVGAIIKGDNGFFQKEEATFAELLYADALRGFDSTGVVGVLNDASFFTMKEAAEAAIFIPKLREHEMFKTMFARGKLWIGHNRKKTIGEIDDKTAHPFVVDDTFAMVHNGTLYNWEKIYEGKVKPVSDSHALALGLKAALDGEHPIEALEAFIGGVYGAYALAFYNQKTEKLHLLRNKERPLYRIESDSAHYFVSEANMGMWIIGRNGGAIDKLKVTSIQEDVLHTFDVAKNSWTEEKITPKKSTTTQTVRAGSIASGVYKGQAVVNESSFRHIKRNLLGKAITFWADDYVENNYPKTLRDDGETDVCVWARTDDVKWVHTVYGEVDLKHFNMHLESDLFDTKWQGVIKEIKLSAVNMLLIDVENVKPIPASINIKDLYKKMLEKMNLVQLKAKRMAEAHKITDWQDKMIAAEIKKREADVKAAENILKSTQDDTLNARWLGLRAAFEEASKQGYELGYRYEPHPVKHVWFRKDTKEIIYESPVQIVH